MLYSDDDYMQSALQMAHKAEASGEVPVGAVVVIENNIIAYGHNSSITTSDPTAHAEVVALRNAAAILKNYRLSSATLYVTLEPCLMCLGAILHARVSRLVFGAYDPRAGMISSKGKCDELNVLQTKLVFTGGILQVECSNILKDFFKKRRNKK